MTTGDFITVGENGDNRANRRIIAAKNLVSS